MDHGSPIRRRFRACARRAFLLAGAFLVVAPAASLADSYRIVDGEMRYGVSATRTCAFPQGSCTGTEDSYRTMSSSTTHGTSVRFKVHGAGAPGDAFGDAVTAARLDIEAWSHEYEHSESRSMYCGTEQYRVTDSDLRHDGGTHPSVFYAAALIAPGAGPAGFTLALAGPEPTEPRFGWTWPTGLRWIDPDGVPTVLTTATSTGSPDCVGQHSSRDLISGRAPFDPYPQAPRTRQDTPPSYGSPRCANGSCLVRVAGVTGWSYTGTTDGSASGDSLTGAVSVDWWFDVEVRQGGDATCNNGQDDDGDGEIDYPTDPGCAAADDDSELGPAQCDNGIDDDGDGFTDRRPDTTGDASCESLIDDLELGCRRGSASPEFHSGLQEAGRGSMLRFATDVAWVCDGDQVRVTAVAPRGWLAQEEGDAFYRLSLLRVLKGAFAPYTIDWLGQSADVGQTRTADGGVVLEVSSGRFRACLDPLAALGAAKRVARLLKRLGFSKRLSSSTWGRLANAAKRRVIDAWLKASLRRLADRFERQIKALHVGRKQERARRLDARVTRLRQRSEAAEELVLRRNRELREAAGAVGRASSRVERLRGDLDAARAAGDRDAARRLAGVLVEAESLLQRKQRLQRRAQAGLEDAQEHWQNIDSHLVRSQDDLKQARDAVQRAQAQERELRRQWQLLRKRLKEEAAEMRDELLEELNPLCETTWSPRLRIEIGPNGLGSVTDVGEVSPLAFGIHRVG